MAKPADRSQQRGDKAIIDRVAGNIGRPAPEHEPAVQSPTTPSGEAVEEQVRREWDPNKDGGLPTFLGDQT